MDKKEKIVNAIIALGTRLSGHGINWIIGGSGSLLVHGLDVVPNDIDLIVDPKDCSEIKKVLDDVLVDTDGWPSEEKTPFIINGVGGDISVRPVNRELVITVKLGNTDILVHKLQVEYEYYKSRTDKIEENKQKISLIEKTLSAKPAA
jgi:hypothetical protein